MGTGLGSRVKCSGITEVGTRESGINTYGFLLSQDLQLFLGHIAKGKRTWGWRAFMLSSKIVEFPTRISLLAQPTHLVLHHFWARAMAMQAKDSHRGTV